MINMENVMRDGIYRELQNELSNQYDKMAAEKLDQMQADMMNQKNRIIGDIINAISIQISDDNLGMGVNIHVIFKNEIVLRK